MPVYFIAEEGTERVKIGFSQWPWDRLTNLQAVHPRKLILLRVINGTVRTEREAQRTFGHLRLEGEWFTYSDEMWDFGEAIDIGPRRKFIPKRNRPGVEDPLEAAS